MGRPITWTGGFYFRVRFTSDTVDFENVLGSLAAKRCYLTSSYEDSDKELIDLLHGSDEFRMADLYTITLSGGRVLRHTGADMPVVWDGQTYESA